MRQVREVGEKMMKGISGRKPDFAMLIDKRGRVVARVRLDENDFGDYAAGRPLVDDALAGYLRDDLWARTARCTSCRRPRSSSAIRRSPTSARSCSVTRSPTSSRRRSCRR